MTAHDQENQQSTLYRHNPGGAGSFASPDFEITHVGYGLLVAENERLRNALATLHEFGLRLMNSDVMEERGIGCCIAEGSRMAVESRTIPKPDSLQEGCNDYATLEWRTDRRASRVVYAMVGEHPSDDDVLIGVMDTRDLACEVVLAHNRAGGWL